MTILKKLTRVALLMSGLAISVMTPQQSRAETLADALVGAYTHSGLLEQNRALLRAADEDVAIAASALRPIISWSSGFEANSSTSRAATSGLGITNSNSNNFDLRLTAEILLYDGGSTKLAIEAAKETVLATRYGLLSIEQSVLLRAVNAFFGVISAVEFVSIAENSQRLLTEELRAAQDRFDVGEVTRTDVAQAESRLAAARSTLARSRGNLFIAQEEYRNVIGRPPGQLVAPTRLPPARSDVEAAKLQAVRSHPDILQVQRQIAATELNILRAQANMQPTVSLDGTLLSNDDLSSRQFNQSAIVGLRLRQTIYAGGALTASVRQASASRDAARGNLHRVRHDIQQDVGSALAQRVVARAALAASEQQIVAARIAFSGIQEEATLGARTTLDVLDAEQELLDAEAQRISAQSEEYIAAYAVLASLGSLTAEQLNLPVERYDPAAYYNLVKDAPIARSKQGRQLDKVLRALGKE